MAECGVCWEIYEAGGAKCPKLLPCNHTVCVSCLKELQLIDSNGKIRCPFCRKLHKIPREQIEKLPTNQLELNKVTWKKNKMIYTLPYSGKIPRIDSGIGMCQLHDKPLFAITYNALEGAEQRFCETCWNQYSGITENNTTQSMCFRQFQSPYNNNCTRNGEVIGENNASGQMINYEEPELLPSWPTNGNHGVENVEQMRNPPRLSSNRNSNAQFMRILKMVAVILCSPIIFIVGLFIALIAIPTGVILSLVVSVYCCFRCRNFNYVYQYVAKFTFYLSDSYANLIARLFCWDVEDYDSDVNRLCQFVAGVVFYLVMFLDAIALVFGTVALSGYTVYRLLQWQK